MADYLARNDSPSVVDSRVTIDDVTIGELVRQYGSPLFVFSERAIRRRFRQMHDAFTCRYANTQFAWSYKTNYLSAICSLMHQQGAIAEIVSVLEYQKTKSLGVPGDQIIFNGPNKPLDTLGSAVADGVFVNIDHIGEVHDLEMIAKKTRRTIDVGIRLNMDVGQETNWARFGFNLENGEALEAAKRICQSGSLRITGLHCHIGTSVVNVDAYQKATQNLVQFGYQVRDKFGTPFNRIDIGGGFASSCPVKQTSTSISTPTDDQYAKAICDQLARTLDSNHQPELIIESGRALIDDAGYLITTVLANKRLPDGTAACVIDAGVNLLHTASTHRLKAEAEFPNQNSETPTTLFGPLCMHTDVVAEKVDLPPLDRGQHIVVSPVGAYNNSLWTQFIEYRPNVVVICHDGSIELIREREDLSDIQNRERLPDRFKAPYESCP